MTDTVADSLYDMYVAVLCMSAAMMLMVLAWCFSSRPGGSSETSHQSHEGRVEKRPLIGRDAERSANGMLDLRSLVGDTENVVTNKI